jgi:isoquinoline 1-oxidoreductase beta subunit
VFGGRVKSLDEAAATAVNGADHMGAAKKGLSALNIEWEDGPHAGLTSEAIARDLDQATLRSGAVAQNIGDADEALANAAVKVEASYLVPFLAHATMEPMNCTVHLRRDQSEIWTGSKRWPGFMRWPRSRRFAA